VNAACSKAQWASAAPRIQMRFIRTSISRTKTIIPKVPLGKYPQFALWGQAGRAPTNIRMSIISNIVPKFMEVLLNSFVNTLSMGIFIGYSKHNNVISNELNFS
jgi:hypothetical protein